MQQRGRPPLSVLEFPHVEGPQPQPLVAPAALNKAERAMFDEVAATAPHLTAIDVPILASFAQAVLLARKLAHENVEAWDKAVRCQLHLGRALRLVASARVHPISTARRVRDASGKPDKRLWE